MELSKLKIITDIIDGKSNRIRESYFMKNYFVIYNEIQQYCSNIGDLAFVQKIWHWVNEIDSYSLCACGNRVTFNKNWLDGYRKTCSNKCAQNSDVVKEKIKTTNIKKYGVDNVAKNSEIKAKIAATNIERYGCTASFQNEIIKQKGIDTMFAKYGVDSYSKTEEFKSKPSYMLTDEFRTKSIETNLKKYGKKYYTQTNEYKEKANTTSLEKYGVKYYTQTEEFKDRVRNKLSDTILKEIKTNLEKYGKEWFTQTELYINTATPNVELTKQTNLKRYGKEWFAQTEEAKLKIIEACREKYNSNSVFASEYFMNNFHSKSLIGSKNALMEKSKNYYVEFGYVLLETNRNIVKLIGACEHEFYINRELFYYRAKNNIDCCTVCNPLNSRLVAQKEVEQWFNSLGFDVKSDWTICKPFELDILIKEKNLAIEYNGLYWHSEQRKNDTEYHRNKTNMCNEKGIQLIHVWEDDWCYKNLIIKSIILNKLNLIADKIYARKCVIKLVNNEDKNNFLENNHIQGKCNSKINMGLYYGYELVSLMTFGNRRINSKSEFELLRFCNKINTHVIGSATKLFKYFLEHYKYDVITSYSDNSMFNGDLYKILGFEFVHQTNTNYWWVVDGMRKHRFNYNKKRLVKMGYDKNKSESQIMSELGYYKIWGCGQTKWSYAK